MNKISYTYHSYGSSQSNLCPLLCMGIALILMGIVSLLITTLGGFTEHFGIAPAIGPIAMICIGSVLLPIGIYYTVKTQKQADETYTEYQPSYTRVSRSRSRVKPYPKNCPACKAPLRKRPPCNCEYCGTLIS